MSLSLFNRRICNTYPGVIKTCDNAALTTTPKPMTDGVGNIVPMDIGTSTICYGGTQDFTGATVIGISGATAGLIPGVGTNSMISNSNLGVLSTADGNCSIAIGNGAFNCCDNSINIGRGSTGLEVGVIGIGFGTSNTGRQSIGLGNSAASTGTCAIAIGEAAQAGGQDGIGVGRTSNARCSNTISIGALSDVLASNGVAIGGSTCVAPDAVFSTVYGAAAASCSANGISIGRSAAIGTCANNAIVIGCSAFVTTTSTCPAGACGSIAIGEGARVCGAGDGLGVTRSIAIGFEACATASRGIAIGYFAKSNCTDGIAIGLQSQVCGYAGLAMAGGDAFGGNSIVIGGSAKTDTNSCFTIAIGHGAGGISSAGNSCNSVIIGRCAGVNNISQCHIAIGLEAGANLLATNGVSIGTFAAAHADKALAFGYNVVGSRPNVLTTCEFESCVQGCGLIVKTPDGLNSYRIAVDNSGNLTTALA